MRCPVCHEVVDPGMALLAGLTPYLLCWSGHRFGLDGTPIATAERTTSIALTECASSEAGAG